MSDAAPERDLLAAEYVLGTLDAAAAREIVTRAGHDPDLQAAIAAWEARLAPLAALTVPVAPPASLWRRLAVSIDPHAVASPATALRRAWRSVVLWRCAAASGVAIAAGLAAVIWLRAPPVRPLAALVPTGSAAAAFVAEREPDGTLRLIALRPVSVAQGKDLELWALPAGASRPIALGLLPPAGRRVVPPKLPAGEMQLMISLEPAGGAPGGLPSGPVLYAGTLGGGGD